MKKDKTINTEEILVFSFVKDSQLSHIDINPETYRFVKNIISKLLDYQGTTYSKIGLGGYKEDVAAYISYIIQAYDHYKQITKLELSKQLNVTEFDPESEPN